jgi:hypothetical protein
MIADLLKSIVGLGIALIPLIIVIVRAFLTRTARTTGILESSRLKALKIERLPFNKEEFDELYQILIKFYLKVFAILAISIAIIELLISALFSFFTKSPFITTNLFIIYLILLLLALILQSLLIYRNARIKGTGSVYDLFKDINIIIKSERPYLFNKCHEVLRIMNFHIEKIDESSGSIIASRLPLITGLLRRVEVNVKSVENLENTFSINIVYTYPRFIVLFDEAGVNKEQLERTLRYNEMLLTPERSRVINRFINLLISKGANGDEMAISKVDQSTDTGD